MLPSSKNSCPVCTMGFVASIEIGYDFKLFKVYLPIREEMVERWADRPSFDPSAGSVAYAGSELMLQSPSWSHGGDHINILTAGFRAVLADGDHTRDEARIHQSLGRQVWPGPGFWRHFCILTTNHSFHLAIARHGCGCL